MIVVVVVVVVVVAVGVVVGVVVIVILITSPGHFHGRWIGIRYHGPTRSVASRRNPSPNPNPNTDAAGKPTTEIPTASLRRRQYNVKVDPPQPKKSNVFQVNSDFDTQVFGHYKCTLGSWNYR